MEIGEHCIVCRQIDFLPFTCPKCRNHFCSKHRDDFNKHCEEEGLLKASIQKTESTHLPSSSSLFPKRERIDLNSLRQKTDEKKISSSALNALKKLELFLKNNSSTKKTSSFLRKKKSGPAQRILDLANLRKEARGDSNVPQSEKIFLWVQYIENDEKSSRTAFFASRAWPIGRLLDSAARHMDIKNVNNVSGSESERLTIFKKKMDGDSLELVDVGDRVVNRVQDGDTVYLVRSGLNGL